MKKINRLVKSQYGFALPMALLLIFIASVIVTPVVWLIATNLQANITVEEKVTGTYAADAGIQYALWKFTQGVEQDTYVAGNPISFPGDDGNGYIYYDDATGFQVSIGVIPVNSEEGYADYKIESVARNIQNDKTNQVIAYVRSATEPVEGTSPFNYALATLNGDVVMTGSSQISCIPNPPATTCDAGDVWINGDIYMGWSNVINGVATMVGELYSPNPNPQVDQIVEGADPISRPTWLDEKTIEYISDTAITLPSFGGTCSTWTDSAAIYNNPVCVNGNMTLAKSGTYRFKDTVWVTGNLVIQSGVNHVFFEKSVRVDGNVTLQGNGDTTFLNESELEVLKIGGYLYIGGSRSVQFQGQVEVVGAQLSSGYAVNIGGSKYSGVAFDIEFLDTLRASEDLHFGSGRSYKFEGVVYTTGNFIMDGYAGNIGINEAVVADGSIFISASAYWYVDYLTAPFLISRKIGCCSDVSSCNATCDGVCLTGSVPVTAIIYAPDSRAYVSGSSAFNGAMVAKCARLDGNVRLNYPVILDDREDLEDPNIGIASDFQLISYSIQD